MRAQVAIVAGLAIAWTSAGVKADDGLMGGTRWMGTRAEEQAPTAHDGGIAGGPTTVYQQTIRGGCISGSTCITFDAVNGPNGGTITFPAAPGDAQPIFGYLYFQFLTNTDCTVDRISDFANATINGININTLPFVEIACLNAQACFPQVATHFYRVDVSAIFPDCDLNVTTFELRDFGIGNATTPGSSWVEGATLMVAYCSESSPSTDVILIEHPQVKGFGADSTDPITYTWSGFNADGVEATLVLGIGNGQGATGTETVRFSTTSTPVTTLGTTDIDGLFDGVLCGGGFYDNTILDVTALVNAGDTSATFTVGSPGIDCLDSNAAFLCVTSATAPIDCVPDACIASTGACCVDGGCQDLTEDDCVGLGGEFNGGTNCAQFACAGAAPASQDRVSATEKGSLLLFSKVELRWNAAGSLVQDTFLELTNDYPESVRVQMYFVNGDPPIYNPPNTPPPLGTVVEPGCNWVDNQITLTADQPTYWSAFDGAPANGGLSPFTVLDPALPLGRPDPDGSTDRVLRGFIYAWAVNSAGEEIHWNHLSGSATLVNHGNGSAWEYNAWAFHNVHPIGHGGQSGTPGFLHLDGVEYVQSFDLLLFNFQAVGASAFSGPASLVQSNTDLTLHPISQDLRQETSGPPQTKATFNVWNMNEVKFSGTDLCLECWDQRLLSRYGVPNHFRLNDLQTDHGKARIDGVQSAEVCDHETNGKLGEFGNPNAILGVAAKLLSFDGALRSAAAGSNLSGMGLESATIIYDIEAPPPSANLPMLPMEIQDVIDGAIRDVWKREGEMKKR